MLVTTRPHAGPPSRSPAPGAARARHARMDVTSGASARRREDEGASPSLLWVERGCKAGVDDGTDKAVGRREGGGFDAGPGALTWSVREPAEKRVFSLSFPQPLLPGSH